MQILKLTLLLCLFAFSAFGQTEKRIALVIGNTQYENSPLTNPKNDARDMANTLREAGFVVTEKYDLDYFAFTRVVNDFGRAIKDPNAVALFYFAGHGVQFGGDSYLVPIGADGKIVVQDDVEGYCVPVDRVIKKMNYAKNKLNILILDACRSFPIASGARNINTGLAEVNENQIPPQLLVAYATRPGGIADDQPYGRNGLYTGTLLKYIRQPGLSLRDVFFETRREVYQRTGQKQMPGESGFFTSEFYFFEGKNEDPVPSPPPDRDGDGIPDKNDKCPDKAGKAYLEGCPETPPALPDDGLVFVKGGTFTMGCTSEQQDCYSDEKPAHSVTVDDFYIGRYEVTQKLWTETMGTNPSHFKNCDDCPVENVSWDDVQDFLKKLNARYPGRNYRLPTEAEWEYAARGGGRQVLFGNGKNVADPDEINFDASADYKKSYSIAGTYRQKTVPVGSLNSPNALGLYDMSGNVWEWCSDLYDSDYYKNSPTANPTGPSSGSGRVIRGGVVAQLPAVLPGGLSHLLHPRLSQLLLRLSPCQD